MRNMPRVFILLLKCIFCRIRYSNLHVYVTSTTGDLETDTVEHLVCDCTDVKDMWLLSFDEFQKLTSFHFVPTLRSCILGIYDVNVENSRITNTIMLLVKMDIMKCKYETCDLCRIAFVRMFAHKAMLLSRTHDNDIFVQLAQMFVGT